MPKPISYCKNSFEKEADPEGWDREGGGSGVQDGEHMQIR